MIFEVERILIHSLGWPQWALRTLALLSFLVIFLTIIQYFLLRNEDENQDNEKKMPSETSSNAKEKKSLTKFRLFQIQYLSVYFIVMLADWLQGTNMYTLYAGYGVNIGYLFLTGFLSSAIFGTFLGIYVDTWGRRFGCILFCVLEIIINLMEHIPSMPILLIGRVLGGLSTSLLFSAFESWMVSEHRKRGFPEEWLATTFSISSWGNGIVAIVAGLFAQLATDISGDIGPFQLAILLTVIALILVLSWEENYGMEANSNSSSENSQMSQSLLSSFQVIFTNPAIFCLGMSQAFFEGGVYTFVFMWVPTLLELIQGVHDTLPTGLVFSAFMLSMSAGGMLFTLLHPLIPGGSTTICSAVYLLSALAMYVPIVHFEFWIVFIAFLLLESMLGMFNSCGATLRSIFYPEQMQSSIMSIFRFPLNLLVVIGTLLTNNSKDREGIQLVYYYVMAMHLIAFILQLCLMFCPQPSHLQQQQQQQPQKKQHKTDANSLKIE